MAKKSSRRAFLTGKSATDAVEHLVDSSVGHDTSAQTSQRDTYLLQIGRRAMACPFEFLFNAGQYPNATDMAVQALDLVDELEGQMTVYREQSDLQTVNRLAAKEPVRLEFRLFKLLELAVELHDATGGAFDITSGPLSKVWGFHRRQAALPTQADIDNALENVGCRHLQLNSASHSVKFLQPHLELNLNSIGKGYALDRCVEVLTDADINDALLHGGHSSIFGLGERMRSEGAMPGWTIAVRHPLIPSEQLGTLVIRDQAIGTSGSANQFFYHQGQRYSHVLDPRTGWPAEDVLSVTVIAESAALADALATAFFVLGPDESEPLCEQYEVSALFVLPSRSGRQLPTRILGDIEFEA